MIKSPTVIIPNKTCFKTLSLHLEVPYEGLSAPTELLFPAQSALDDDVEVVVAWS